MSINPKPAAKPATKPATKTRKVTRTTPTIQRKKYKTNPDLTSNSINLRLSQAHTQALTDLIASLADINKTSIIRQALTIGFAALLAQLGTSATPTNPNPLEGKKEGSV